MRTGLLIGLTVAGAGFLALAAAGREVEGGKANGAVATRKQRFWSRIETIAELDNTQRYFLTLVAYRESKFNPAAHNGSVTERAAAAQGLANSPSIRGKAQACGVAMKALSTGSWGLFQRLAPFWADDMFDIFGVQGAYPYVDPSREVSNMNLQIVSAIKVAHTLQQYSGWKAYPTAGNLRLGWASPDFMGYISAHADRLQRYREDADAADLPSSLVDGTIREFPTDYRGIYTRLGGAG